MKTIFDSRNRNLTFAAIIFIIFCLFGLKQMDVIIGTSTTPDKILFINLDLLKGIVSQYTPQNISGYTINALTLDLIWPLIYSAFSYFFIKRINSNAGMKRIGFIIVFVALCSDYIENISNIVFMRTNLNFVAIINVIFSNLKWASLLLVIIVIVILILISLFKSKTKSIKQ